MYQSIKKNYRFIEKLIFSALAVALAIVLPQVFHFVGILTGQGANLGQIFLPMYIPVLVAGMCLGPFWGIATGIISPALSNMLTGMPAPAMLLFIALETSVCAFVAGILRGKKISPVLKVFLACAAGKLTRVAAVLIFAVIAGTGTEALKASMSVIAAGAPGMILQIISVPLIVKAIERARL